MNSVKHLLTVSHPDQHLQRRGRLLIILSLALITLAILYLPITLMGTRPFAGTLAIVFLIVISVGTLLLGRSGRVSLGAWLFLLTLLIAVVGSILGGGVITSLFYLVVTVITASVLLPPVQVWWVLLVNFVGIGVSAVFVRGALSDPVDQAIIGGSAFLLTFAALVSYLGGKATEQALRTSEDNERRVTEALGQAEAQSHKLEEQAEALREAEQRQRELVATLETPTVAVAEGVLLAPIVGTIDSARALKLTTRLLQDVSSARVRVLIMDLAGVSLIDTAVAQALIHTVQAVRLLGCAVTITGISGPVATTMVHLGIEFDNVQTARSPQDVLTHLSNPSVTDLILN